MEFINNIYFNALGLTLLHSLWQGALIGLLFFVAKNLFHQHPARLRFRIGAFALLSQFIFAMATFIILISNFSPNPMADNPTELLTIAFVNLTESSGSHTFWLSAIGLIWLAGSVFCLVRLSRGWWLTRQLKTVAQPLAKQWQQLAQEIGGKMNLGKKIQAFSVENIHVPFTIGFFKPIILFPIGMVNHLAPGEVEAILAHELAHIKYQDYFLNLIFSTIEALFYFHPVVWWISAEINDAREESCDDLAIEIMGDRMQYARTLVRVQETSNFYLNTGLAFSGKKGHLTQRIHKILNMPYTKKKNNERFFGFMLVGIIASILWMGATKTFQQEDIHPEFVSQSDTDVIVSAEEQEEDLIYVKIKDVPQTEIIRDQQVYIISKTPATGGDPNKFSEVRFMMHRDTTPDKKESERTITKSINGQKTKLKMKNNQITFLMLDGKVIDPEDYDKYEAEVTEFLNSTPPPPPPPPAPRAPRFPNGDIIPPPPPPAPAAPRSNGLAPVPPVPPVAPVPPVPPVPDLSNFEIDLSAIMQDFNFAMEGFDSAMVLFDGEHFNNFTFENFDFENLDLEEFEVLIEEQLINQNEWQEKLQLQLENIQIDHELNLKEFLEKHEEEIQKQQQEIQEHMQELHKQKHKIRKEKMEKMEKMEKNKEYHKDRKKQMKQLKSKSKTKRKKYSTI